MPAGASKVSLGGGGASTTLPHFNIKLGLAPPEWVLAGCVCCPLFVGMPTGLP